MFAIKNSPFLSLSLLLVSYIVFGWLLPTTPSYWWMWLLAVSLSLIIALILASPLNIIPKFFKETLGSDNRAFISIILAAFAAVVIICWIQVSTNILLLLSASILAKLDLQVGGYNEIQSFLILTLISLTGLSLGIIMHLLGGSIQL